MATGETMWSTGGKTARHFENTPVAPGEYDLKLDASKLEIGRKPEPGKMPYIKGVRFEVLGTAQEGGRNRSVYNLMFTSCSPGNNGFVLVEKGNQILGMAQAVGEEFSAPVKAMQWTDDQGEEHSAQYLSPQALVNWLKAHDGSVMRGRVKVKKEKDRPDSNEIDYFMPSTTASAFDSETGEVLEETVSEETPVDDAMEADSAEVEDLPPVKKPAPKPAAKVTTLPKKTGTRR